MRCGAAAAVCSARAIARAAGAELYFAAGLQFVLTVGYYCVPGIKAAGYGCIIALGNRYRYRARLDRLVGLHQINEGSLRATQYRGRRHDCAVLPRLEKQVRIHELVGPKLIVFVIENGFQLGCSRGLVDLVINRLQFASRQLGLIVSAVSLDQQRRVASCVVIPSATDPRAE